MMVVTSAKTLSAEKDTRQRLERTKERPSEIYQKWESKYTLKYTLLPPSAVGDRPDCESCIYVKPVPSNQDTQREAPAAAESSPLPGDAITLGGLQEMAARQHRQIVAQEKALLAKERRLQHLKDEDARAKRLAEENARLRQLKECVARQEQKLGQLRTRKEQVDQNKVNNASLDAAASSVRSKAQDKAQELTAACSQLDALVRMLQELRVQRRSGGVAAVVAERDQLRRELASWAREGSAQACRTAQLRSGVAQRLSVLGEVTSRIAQLEERLQRRRALNAKTIAENEARLRQRLEFSHHTNSTGPRLESKSGHSYCQVAIQGKQSCVPRVEQQIQMLQRSKAPPQPSHNVGRLVEPSRAAFASPETLPFKARSHQKATSCTYLKPPAPTKISSDAKVLALTGTGQRKGSICSVLLSYDEVPNGRATIDFATKHDDHSTRFYRRRSDAEHGNAKAKSGRHVNLASKGSCHVKQHRVGERTCHLSEETRKSVTMKIKNIRNNNNSLGFAPDIMARK